MSREGVPTDPEKTAKVARWPTPTLVLRVQQFLGLASYYRRLVCNFAENAKPLHRLTEHGKKFVWMLECEIAFATLEDQCFNLILPRFLENPILLRFLEAISAGY